MFWSSAPDPTSGLANPVVRYHEIYRERFPATLGDWFFLLENDKAGSSSWVEVEMLKIMKIMVWGLFQAPFGRKIGVGAVLRTMF